MWRITSKAIREHPVFALRVPREAIQSTSHRRPSMSSWEYCCGIVSTAALRAPVAATGKGFQGGWRHVKEHAIGDGLRAGVTKDDLSEEALGAVCFGGFKGCSCNFKSSKTTTGVLRAEGTARSRATEGRRNGINRGDPALRGVGGLCRIRFTLDRIKANPEATGRALRVGGRIKVHHSGSNQNAPPWAAVF